ncbi:hypothetical protein C8R45DRAFT_1181124 [Mycena sanguinolenta]|nr:hypothetical protein C8R45DRAFT_1181124 [Mycena sanguinolenta]
MRGDGKKRRGVCDGCARTQLRRLAPRCQKRLGFRPRWKEGKVDTRENSGMIVSSVSPQSPTRVVVPRTPVSATTTLLKYVPALLQRLLSSIPGPRRPSCHLTSESSQLLHLCSVQILFPPFSSYRLPSSTRKLSLTSTPPYDAPLRTRSPATPGRARTFSSPFPPVSFPPLSLVALPITSIIPTYFLLGNFPTRLEDEYASNWAPARAIDVHVANGDAHFRRANVKLQRSRTTYTYRKSLAPSGFLSPSLPLALSACWCRAPPLVGLNWLRPRPCASSRKISLSRQLNVLMRRLPNTRAAPRIFARPLPAPRLSIHAIHYPLLRLSLQVRIQVYSRPLSSRCLRTIFMDGLRISPLPCHRFACLLAPYSSHDLYPLHIKLHLLYYSFLVCPPPPRYNLFPRGHPRFEPASLLLKVL